MTLSWIDWTVIVGYFAFTILVGIVMRKRASSSVDEYFLSGRTLPWWLAGTSMVATSFASDTPLVVSGWVRDFGIWKNWLWWCYAMTGMFGVFVFARWWRRSGVMTKAELTELRYGGREARLLRGFLGVLHAGVMNTMVLNWVIVAAKKILGVVFEIDDTAAVAIACGIAMSYSLLSGFWGVVITDLVQFAIAVTGAVCLATICWSDVGGIEAVRHVVEVDPKLGQTLSFLPSPESATNGILDPRFWTAPVAALAVYLGVAWWSVEGADGSPTLVQRVAASRDERQGMLAVMWFNVAHYALRPWPWILVGLASLVVLPKLEVRAPVAGFVQEIDTEGRTLTLVEPNAQATEHVVELAPHDHADDWQIEKIVVRQGVNVAEGDLLGRSDAERAYIVMLRRYLPIGLLGLVIASLLAAFMSTIDTHVNLAASFFVNDVYRRFWRPHEDTGHYVLVARLASLGVLAVGGLLALTSDHIGKLFEFFLAFLAGVGPIYMLRWLWWRIAARTEIVALVTSAAIATTLTYVEVEWPSTPLSPGGKLEPAGRLLLVVGCSLFASLLAIALLPKPNPERLVDFYRRVRPFGAWGPVRALAPDVERDPHARAALVGIVGGLALVFGALFGSGCLLLERPGALPAAIVTVVGAIVTSWSLSRIARGGS
ncbi:MAG: Na+:solute symporter [Planctomycetes bacterium]|nr:Na+:solute symporter [Planctomycetota bacterium]